MHSKKWMASVLALSMMLSTAPTALAEAAEPPAIHAETSQGETVKTGENTVKVWTKLNFTPAESGYYGFGTKDYCVFSYSEEMKACRKGEGSFIMNEHYYGGDIFYLEQGKTYSFSLDKVDGMPEEYTLGIFKMKEPNDLRAEESILSYPGKENDSIRCDFFGQESVFSEISAESSDPTVASVRVEKNIVKVNSHKVGTTKITMKTKNGLTKTCDYRVVNPIPVKLKERKEVTLGQGGILSFTAEESGDYVLCIPKGTGYDYDHRFEFGMGGIDPFIGDHIRYDFRAEAGKTYYMLPIVFTPNSHAGDPTEPGPITVFVEKTVPVESIEVVPDEGTDPDSIYPGRPYDFRVKTTPLYTSGQINWTVSDPDLVQLENHYSEIQYGGGVTLRFLAEGEVTLTATAENGVTGSLTIVCKEGNPIQLDEKFQIQRYKRLVFTAPEDGHYLIKDEGVWYFNNENSFFYQDGKGNSGYAFSAGKGEKVKLECRNDPNAKNSWVSISKMPELESVNLPKEIIAHKDDTIFFTSYCNPSGCYVDLPQVRIDIENPEVVTLDDTYGLGVLKVLREGATRVTYTMPDGTEYTTTIRINPIYDTFTQDEIQNILAESKGQNVLKIDTIKHNKTTEIVEINYNDLFGTVAEKFDALEFITQNGSIKLDKKALEHLRNEKCAKVQMGLPAYNNIHSMEYPSLEGKQICANYAPSISIHAADGAELPIGAIGEGTVEYKLNFTPSKDISAYELYGIEWLAPEGTALKLNFTYTDGQLSVKTSRFIDWFSVVEKNDGWQHDDNGWFYTQNGEKAVSTWMKDSVGWCYLNEEGYLTANAWVTDSTGWCYLDGEGHVLKNGWAKDGAGWCYLNADGYLTTNAWAEDSTGWCYLDDSGHTLTNSWKSDSHGWCYLDGEGRMLKNGWAKDGAGWCYLNADGYLTTNAWAEDSAGWCYLDDSGHTLTNSWKSDSHGWCYLDGEGRMLKNGWAKDSKGWCYLSADGYMMTHAWAKDSAGWCYLDDSGHTLTNSWKSDSHGWCYLDGEGRMLKNGWAKDSTGWCYLDSNGYMLTNGYAYDSAGRHYLDATGHMIW